MRWNNVRFSRSVERRIERCIIDSFGWLSIARGDILCNQIAYDPCLKSVTDIFLSKLNSSTREIHGMRRAMKTKLHRKLHHDARQREGHVGCSAPSWERPCAEKTECLDNIMAAWWF